MVGVVYEFGEIFWLEMMVFGVFFLVRVEDKDVDEGFVDVKSGVNGRS